jgi:hypothetical protein
LYDENNHLLLEDTSAFEIFLSEIQDDTTIRKQIYFSNNDDTYSLTFIPSQSSTDNKCQAVFIPELHPGKYKLEANGKDATGNLSGDNYYSVCFVVDSSLAIEHFYCYPNPFSSRIHFAFTLKYAIPDNFFINIYDIRGRFVKRLNLLNDNVYVGYNISNITWDGTNYLGQTVQPGVYIFKVYATYNKTTIPIGVSTPGNKPLKGFGKIIYRGK